MQHACKECSETFESHSKKANHIRWHHRKPYTKEGLGRVRKYVANRYGEMVSEKRTCRCGVVFTVTFRKGCSSERTVKKHCSRSCANSRKHSVSTRAKMSTSMKRHLEDPENLRRCISQLTKIKNRRCSSKAERALGEVLSHFGFKRHKVIVASTGSFDIDIHYGDIWIESDGPWHFQKMHESHDFERTKRRDAIEEFEALRQGKLLIRVDNQKHSIEKQVNLIQAAISEWDGKTGKVAKYY